MNLKMNLLDAVHRNDELSEVLAQKEQQLEHQDKTSRAQTKVIKVTSFTWKSVHDSTVYHERHNFLQLGLGFHLFIYLFNNRTGSRRVDQFA